MQNLFVRRESRYEMRDNDVYNIPRFKLLLMERKASDTMVQNYGRLYL